MADLLSKVLELRAYELIGFTQYRIERLSDAFLGTAVLSCSERRNQHNSQLRV